jgi:peroxiredoxin
MKWRSLDESTAKADIRTLKEQLAERKTVADAYAPAETQALHARVIEEIRDSRILDRVLSVGSPAPIFELEDQNGRTVYSSELLQTGRLIIIFFRGRWCPFCVAQLQAMNLVLPQIKHCDASLVAISPQTTNQSSFMADQHKLMFPLLSDSGNKVARSFGLAYRVAEGQQAVYRRAFVNLPFVNGDDSWELPIPASFVIERDGSILYASADPDYTQRPEPSQLLQAISR